MIEPAPAPVPEPVAAATRSRAEPEPEGPFVPPRLGDWTVRDVERLLDEHGDAFPDRTEELHIYLDSFRGVADPDGRLPGGVEGVMEDVFRDLIERAKLYCLAGSEEPEGDPGRLVADRLCRLGRERPPEPDRVGELAKRASTGGPDGIGARDRLASSLDDGQVSRRLDPGEQLRELVGAEGLLPRRARLDDGGGHVMTLEADDEVGGAQILAEERARPVLGEVEARGRAELDRVRERRYAGGVERAERRDAHG